MAQENTKCPNCEKEFDSSYNYCPYCGQKNIDPDPKLKHFLNEFLSANFNLDSKIFITLQTLVLKPAKLSKEFISGKRESYITPVRLYLFISLIYFFTLSFDEADNSTTVMQVSETEADTTKNTLIAVSIDDVNPDTLKGFNKQLYHKLEVMNSPYGQKVFLQNMKKNISLGMFILIPLTALIMFLLFRKKTKYYIPNLIFTIHLQSLIFIWMTLFNIIAFIFDFDLLFIAEALFILYIIFIWFRSFYEDSTGKTIWRMFLFLLAYTIVGILFLFIDIGFSLWFVD